MNIKVADEVWIGCALLQRENPNVEGFSKRQILQRITEENIFGQIRPGVSIHISTHCIANSLAQPNKCRMLYRMPNATVRLFKEKDYYHPSREDGKRCPDSLEIPQKYHYLIEWYKKEYYPHCSAIENRSKKDAKLSRHSERCPQCKIVFQALLKQIYGEVHGNYKFDIGTHPTDFHQSKLYPSLEAIFNALQNSRGYNDFVKSGSLPRCDYFIPKAKTIVEFDESQHFTSARKIALELYPEGLELGFDKKKWIDLCLKLNKKDNDPPYRDEQRAWYDTLRDFLPTVCNLAPTIRVYAQDFPWCTIDPENEAHRAQFVNLLKVANSQPKLFVRKDDQPTIARVIIGADWYGKLEDARKILENVVDNWPDGESVKFLLTCGGFLQFDWPKTLTLDNIGDNRYPNKDAVQSLIEKGDKYLEELLGDGLKERLAANCEYITIGIDSRKSKVSKTKNRISEAHIEMVVLVDLEKNRKYWTGKSYPTSNQENSLIRFSDLRTHFINSDIGKIMILGCNDLAVFNPRSIAVAKAWRKHVNEEFTDLAIREKPLYVLHHPHTTVSKRTWFNSWQNLSRTLKSVKHYAGAGLYFESDRERSKWDPIYEVLLRTKKTDTIDFIFK
ncbi:MAG: hypothetical protein QM398_02415 [Thermoproteota archaeon]|nr:hypothetical protein [Thermoproteota archaeon]